MLFLAFFAFFFLHDIPRSFLFVTTLVQKYIEQIYTRSLDNNLDNIHPPQERISSLAMGCSYWWKQRSNLQKVDQDKVSKKHVQMAIVSSQRV